MSNNGLKKSDRSLDQDMKQIQKYCSIKWRIISSIINNKNHLVEFDAVYLLQEVFFVARVLYSHGHCSASLKYPSNQSIS